MNGIMGMAHLVLNTDLTPQQRDYVEKIYGTCDSLLQIVNDLLDFSKIEADRLELEQQPFCPAQELEAVMVLLRPRASNHVSLESHVDPRLPAFLTGDALRLRQILLNLGGNAVKFSQKGRVCISLDFLRRQGGQVWIRCSISDEGIGMSREEKKLLRYIPICPICLLSFSVTASSATTPEVFPSPVSSMVFRAHMCTTVPRAELLPPRILLPTILQLP